MTLPLTTQDIDAINAHKVAAERAIRGYINGVINSLEAATGVPVEHVVIESFSAGQDGKIKIMPNAVTITLKPL